MAEFFPLFILLLVVSCKVTIQRPLLPGMFRYTHCQELNTLPLKTINPKLDSRLQVTLKNFQGDANEENYIWSGRQVTMCSKNHEGHDVFFIVYIAPLLPS